MITPVDKVKITQYLKKHASGDLYYDDFKEVVNRKKCTDRDLLEYFVVSCEQFLEKQSISLNLFLKYLELIGIFIQIMQESQIKISDDIIKRIIFLKRNYEVYCKVNDVDFDEEINNFLNELFNYVIENYKVDLESGIEEDNISEAEILEKRWNKEIESRDAKIDEQALVIDAKEKKIIEQRERIKELRKQKEDVELSFSDLKKTVKQLQELLDESKNNELKSKNVEADLILRLQKLEDRIISLQNTKAKLEAKIIFLEEELSKIAKVEAEKEYLLTQKEELQGKLDLLSIQVEELEKQRAFKSFGDHIDMIILEKLFGSGIGIEEIKVILEQQQIYLSFDEIRERIKYLSLKFAISTSFSKGKKKYFISSLPSSKNTSAYLDLVDAKDYIDFLFVADHHIYEQNLDAVVKVFDSIIDFCLKNGITQVVHLGDIFDFNRYSGSIYDFERLLKFRGLVDQLIEKIPSEKSIQHIALGGNHEEDLLKFGVDLLQYFVRERDDFSLVGYQNSLLKVVHNDILVGNFLLSHPYNGIIKAGLKERVENFEERFGTDISFAFFGHHHASYLDLEARGCIAPSLSVDRICNGAWFVRVNLKENKMDGMTFKPLVLERKLTAVSEIIYSVPK